MIGWFIKRAAVYKNGVNNTATTSQLRAPLFFADKSRAAPGYAPIYSVHMPV